jgi:RNA polymerase subunit RPABC4/transcription elongation factor Spt4
MLTFFMRFLVIVGLAVAAVGVVLGASSGSGASERIWNSFQLTLVCGVLLLTGEIARHLHRVDLKLAGLSPPLPGYWACQSCRQLASIAADFCPRCGAERLREATADVPIELVSTSAGQFWRCPSCHTLARDSQAACSNCHFERAPTSRTTTQA